MYETVQLDGSTKVESFWLQKNRKWVWQKRHRKVSEIPHPNLDGALRTANYLFKVEKGDWIILDDAEIDEMMVLYVNKRRGLRQYLYSIQIRYLPNMLDSILV